MQLPAILVGAFASLITVQAAMIPEGTPDGIYLHPIHPISGERDYVRIGDTNTTTPHHASTKKRKTGSFVGIRCDSGHTASSTDMLNAVSSMENGFGQGLSWSKQISFVSGGAVAYACDYGNGQTTTSFQVVGWLGDVQSQCGDGNAGWYDIEPWKASYGRTSTGTSFC